MDNLGEGIVKMESNATDTEKDEELLTESQWLTKKNRSNKIKDAIYDCLTCARKFSDASNLRRHMQKYQHYEGVRYPCEECDYKAKHPSHLKKHSKAHTKEHSKIGQIETTNEIDSKGIE